MAIRVVSCLLRGAVALLFVSHLAACNAGAPGAGPVAAEIEGRSITVAELDRRIKERLFAQATDDEDPARIYELRSEALRRLVDEQLLEAEARERGSDPEALLQQELADLAAPGDAEIAAFYAELGPRAGESSLEELTPRIREHLEREAQQQARQAFLARLREGAGVAIRLEPPRVEVDARGPSRGGADAAVTIVEFSDYQCPYCKRAEPTLAAVLERYPQQVRWVYRHFPLDSIHPLARRASEAAACADEQGRFWPYHTLLFEHAPAFEEEQLVAYAEQVGLELEGFRSCLAEGRHSEAVAADLEAGRRAGVSGTPAFFVNGIPLSGARPLEDFVEIIEQELERAATPAVSDAAS